MGRSNGTNGGAFTAVEERLTLVASRGIDPLVMDAVATLWRRGKDQLRPGHPIGVADGAAERDLGRAVGAGRASLTVLPVFDGDELVALLYVDNVEPALGKVRGLDDLAGFSRIVARAIRLRADPTARNASAWEAYLERTPVDDIQRQKLLLLLDRHHWNIACVARLMRVTRRTVYLRLRRYNIPRQRVSRKARLRSTGGASGGRPSAAGG